MAFDDDLVKCKDDGNTTLVPGNLTGNAVRLAVCKVGFPPCACAAGEAACQALQGGVIIWFLDAIACMNSTVIDQNDKPKC